MKRQARIAIGSRVLYFGDDYIVTGFDGGGYTLEVPDKGKRSGYYKGVPRKHLTLIESNQPESTASGLLIINHDGSQYELSVDDFVSVAQEYVDELEQSSLSTIPQPLAELEALRQQVAKLEGDLSLSNRNRDYARYQHEKAQRMALNLAEKNAQTRKENEHMKEVIDIIADLDLISDGLELLADVGNWDVWATLQNFKEEVLDKASAEALESTDVVTLTDDELRWIAEQWNGKLVVRINPFSVPTKYQHLVRSHHQSDLFTDFMIAPEYDTPTNRKAIEARRLQLAEKA